jgi:PhoPQ-activated pathogenicity-related protein
MALKWGIVVTIAVLAAAGSVSAQPVFDYVNRPDDAYGWEVTGERPLSSGVTMTELRLISQVWQGIKWRHRVQVLTPDGMEYPETALLLITGGTAGADDLSLLGTVAGMMSAPVVVLGDIPNQPLFDNLSEDALIAFTFRKALETGQTDWPLLFPMTKAAVKVMDAVEEYTQKAWEKPVRSFFVTGASKRGWTTWFTSVVAAERIVGIAPMVYDNLNLKAQMALHLEAWGEYSEQIHDYTELGLPELLASGKGNVLAGMVDPYTYQARATMPKLIITATNDRYWPLDAAKLYFGELPEPKYILYVPNRGHSLGDYVRVIAAQAGFFAACTGRAQLPKLEWKSEQGRHLKLHVSSDIVPLRVRQWTAWAPTRDFREAQWTSRELRPHEGKYTGRVAYPNEGFAAMFAEVVYEIEGRQMPLSSSVNIVGPRGE